MSRGLNVALTSAVVTGLVTVNGNIEAICVVEGTFRICDLVYSWRFMTMKALDSCSTRKAFSCAHWKGGVTIRADWRFATAHGAGG